MTRRTTGLPLEDMWTTSEVATYLRVEVCTVSHYRGREQMPAPDVTVGRTHLWDPARIRAWRPCTSVEPAP